MIKKEEKLLYDVIVIGAGHSGCEAALASARNGARTLLVTISLDAVILMPFGNELSMFRRDALIRNAYSSEGEILKNIMRNYINVRVERNKKELPYERLVFLVDERKYSLSMKKVLENQKNLDTRQGLAVDISKKDKVFELKTSDGIGYISNCIVICTGSFLNGKIFWGKYEIEAGRQGEICSKSLLLSLKGLGFKFGLRRNYAAPVIDRKTIDEEKLGKQMLDNNDKDLLSKNGLKWEENKDFYIAYAGERLNEYIFKKRDVILQREKNKELKKEDGAPLEERITDKLLHEKNKIFAFPLGKDINELYLKGLETALAEELQLGMIREIKGFYNAEMTRPGYGIEYSYLKDFQVDRGFESREIEGMFFAGKVIGSESYEEAAYQGIISGINAAKKSRFKGGIVLENSS